MPPAADSVRLASVLMQVSLEQPAAEAGERAARKAELLARAYAHADLSGYTFQQRLTICAADLAFYLLIKLIGGTTRFNVEGWEHWEAATRAGQQPIYTFWHDRILLATYFWQRRGIVVMTSQSFDGEYI